MFKKTDRSTKAATWGRPLLCGSLTALLTTSVLLLLFSALCVASDAAFAFITPLAFFSVAVSAAVGGFTAGKLARRQGWLLGLLCGLLLWVLSSLVGGLCVGALFGARTLWRLLLCAICGAVGGITGVNTRRRDLSV